MILDQKERASPLPLIFAAALFVGGGFYLAQPSLKSPRPSQPKLPEFNNANSYKVRTRPWEDPFTTVYQHKYDAKAANSDNTKQPDDDDTENHAKSNGAETDTRPHSLAYVAKHIALKMNLSSDSKESTNNVTILAIMVNHGPDPADVENRLRTRYAVFGAMNIIGFEPTDAQNIEYFEMEECSIDKLKCRWNALSTTWLPCRPTSSPTTQPASLFVTPRELPKTQPVPFEWMRRSNVIPGARSIKGDNILVLWIPEQLFGSKPLQGIAYFIGDLRHEISMALRRKHDKDKNSSVNKTEYTPLSLTHLRKRIPFKILGPAGSQTLLKMTNESLKFYGDGNVNESLEKDWKQLKRTREQETSKPGARPHSTSANSDPPLISAHTATWVWSQLTGTEIYCSKATIMDVLLLQGNDAPCTKFNMDDATCVREAIHNMGPTLYRTTCTDDMLAIELVAELKRRGVNISSDHDRIALIYEQDTIYGRAMPLTFLAAVLKERNKELARGQLSNTIRVTRLAEEGWPKNLRPFSYLKGLDGRLPGEQVNSQQQSSDAQSDSRHVEYMERAEGKPQLDYVARLTSRLESIYLDFTSTKATAEDNTSRAGVLKAIGIFGTDAYDKLLMLRALRHRFPDALFFTTDLDARLLSPREFEWTRNLIVASSFGLELHEDHQRQIPPFRGTYQSATFASCLAALDYDKLKAEDLTHMFPRIFEIGRQHAINLTVRPQAQKQNSTMPPIHPRRKAELMAWGRIIVALLQSLFALLLAGILLMFLHKGMWHRFHRLYPLIPKIWKIAVPLVILLPVLLGWIIWIFMQDEEGEPFYITEGVSIWPTIFFRVSVVFLCWYFLRCSRKSMGCMYATISKELHITQKPDIISPFRAMQNIISHTDTFNFRSLIREIRNWRKSIGVSSWTVTDTPINIVGLWREYERRGSTFNSYARALPPIVVFIILTQILMAILGRPGTPYRGEISSIANTLSLIFSVPALILLVFYVVDITRLCGRFIINMAHSDSHWPEDKIQEYATHKLEEPVLSNWLDIHLIARITKIVGRIMIYPFVPIFIMIISRSRYFDNWHISSGLFAVISLTIVCSLFSALLIRRAAEKARRRIVGRLQEQLFSKMGAGKAGQSRVEQIRMIIEEIQNNREGAFSHWSQHPVVAAILLPFTGVGGLAILDYVL